LILRKRIRRQFSEKYKKTQNMCIAIDVGIQASDVEDFLKIRPKIKFNN